MYPAQRNWIEIPTLLPQFLRYLVVGMVAFVVDFAVLVLSTEGWRVHYLLGATLGFMAGLMVNYALSVAWVFSRRSMENRSTEFLVFGLIGVVGLGVTAFLMWFGADILGIDYRICKVVTVAVVLVWNFGLRRFLLFGGAER